MATTRKFSAAKVAKASKSVTFVATGDATVDVVETATTTTVTVGASAPGGSGLTALTGDVTASGSGSVAATIAAGAVTLAKMANMATDSFLGRDTAGAGAPEVLSAATARSVLGLGAAALAATLDAVPAPVASVDFAGEQAVSFVIENRTDDTGCTQVGRLWLRTDL